MKRYLPVVLLLLACSILFFSIYGADSFSKVHDLRHSLALQQDTNAATAKKVKKLAKQISGLQSDKRALEKAARNELGLAAEDEFIVVFDKQEAGDHK